VYAGLTGIRFPVEARDFSRLSRVQTTGFGAHPASYPMCTGVQSRRVKRLDREAEHSFPSTSEVKNSGAITSMPSHDFFTWCLIK
jgi:hypothetical protein